MVNWVFFFHRERRVDKYGKKGGPSLLRTWYVPSTTLDALGSCPVYLGNPHQTLIISQGSGAEHKHLFGHLVTSPSLQHHRKGWRRTVGWVSRSDSQNNMWKAGSYSHCHIRRGRIRGPPQPAQWPLNIPTASHGHWKSAAEEPNISTTSLTNNTSQETKSWSLPCIRIPNPMHMHFPGGTELTLSGSCKGVMEL